ncbi:hypothetical protein BU24DRAFT_443965 [Aaosphaeria arxii CBS 175.79]|uniref:BTB domain-containing protein n=1 Tax=Aaosphaeria arxii CBS 175.79 TaxID=1450172 RepID=A0A6A5XFZ0_9PLEO|nr:uncharacterized protein BU24DRAFT_443965 [Aaosphaeria arxii CBS 175.79]KAF2011747.1 hypothetical protein BU24DRAFT_443965 [Aaosphaeria arxii CBS 175.79]
MHADNMAREPTILPPPYTSTGMRTGSLRSNARNFCTIAELLVGPDPSPTRFLLHTSLLTSQSPYFRAALMGPFLESSSQSIRLADITVDIFELCVAWLYTGDIHPVPFKDGRPAYYTLLHLYGLADRLCFEGLRNRVVDLISDLADSTNSVLTPSDTRILYDTIPYTSPLRTLVLDLFAFKKTDKLVETHVDRWHAHFLRDLCVRLKRPCEQATTRHVLRMWCPETWHATRACEGCRMLLPPRYGAVVCDECGFAWCVRCIGEGTGMAAWEDGRGRWETSSLSNGMFGGSVLMARSEPGSRDSHADRVVPTDAMKKLARLKCRKWESCKPWRGARCMTYHEHQETDTCGDVFRGH